MAVESLHDRMLALSVRRLSEEFGMARETIQKRIGLAGVRSCDVRLGHPVYRLRDVVPALFDPLPCDADGEMDPRLLPPEKRKAWYQSEHARIGVETELRRLLPAAESEAEYAELVKGLIQFLDTLGDQLERDCGLTPEQVESVNESISNQRQAFYTKLIADEYPEQAQA